MQAARDRQKSYADLKRKTMEFQVGDKVMLKRDLPEELSKVHNTFHVSNLKKCHAEEPLAIPLDGLHFDDKLHFMEESVEIVDREVKRLKRSRIPLVKVRWNSKRGPEFTWEREDQFRKKYPHLFARTASTSKTTKKIVLIKQRIQAAQDRQKSYADLKRKPMEFEIRDMVMLKVLAKVAYRMELPQELSRVHHTFHVSNMKKCYADEPLVMPLEGIHVDDKLQFVEEPVEIMEREIKRLKQSRIPPSSGQIIEALRIEPVLGVSVVCERNAKMLKPFAGSSLGLAK
nr:putative reverse transcriptase domain-containing protein [Tanacetum cinerariifolium]